MRRQHREKRLKKNSSIFLPVIILTIVLSMILTLIFIWYKVYSLPKFSYVEKSPDNGSFVTIIDSKSDKSVRYKINPDKVLSSSRGLGEYKLESLWILSEKEGYKGSLVSESVTSNFLSPVYLWKNGKSSNLNIFQKIKVFLISKQNIAEEKVLNDFELSNSILINFVNNSIQESGSMVEIEDLTGNSNTVAKISSILGTLGTKVSGYTKGYDENLDCEVSGSDPSIVKEISKIFDCDINSDSDSPNIHIRIGAKFSDRF